MLKLEQREIDLINRHLTDKYGKMEDMSFFRLVWGEDIFETRIMDHTDKGVAVLFPEARLVPKYFKPQRERYILEGLHVISKFQDTDLVANVTYEPMWTFQDSHGVPLIPTLWAIEIILEAVRNAQEKKHPEVKYKEDLSPEALSARIDAMERELYGNETSVGDALAYHGAVIVPNNYKKES